MYTYTLTVQKDYSSIGIISSPPPNITVVEIDVQCNMKEFTALSDPKADTTGKVEVAAGDSLTFDVELGYGANPQYEFIWGDGTNTTVDGSVGSLMVFSRSHQYTESGNYTVKIRVYNNNAEIKLDDVPVEVSVCVFPEVSFVESSPASPLTYTRGSTFDLTARWSYTSQKCQIEQEPNFSMVGWSFKNSANVTLTNPNIVQEFTSDVFKWNVHVPKLVLAADTFTVHLQLTDGKKVKDYYAYLKVIETPLVAEITNGVERSISAFQILEDGNTTFLNFTVDALPSHDPDDKGVGHQGKNLFIIY